MGIPLSPVHLLVTLPSPPLALTVALKGTMKFTLLVLEGTSFLELYTVPALALEAMY